MRLHQIIVCYEPPNDAEEIECTIHYTYTPGAPERGPTYACGGTPAEPAEVELDHCDPSTPETNAWAAAYLQDAGYDDAVRQACGDLEPDPDEARDRRMDDARRM